MSDSEQRADPADYDICDEHETAFFRGDKCPECKSLPIVDYASSCDGCGCSALRAHSEEALASHPAPFWCNHPALPDVRKVWREEQPFTSRPSWCPLDKAPVLIVAAERVRAELSDALGLCLSHTPTGDCLRELPCTEHGCA